MDLKKWYRERNCKTVCSQASRTSKKNPITVKLLKIYCLFLLFFSKLSQWNTFSKLKTFLSCDPFGREYVTLKEKIIEADVWRDAGALDWQGFVAKT